MSHNTVVVNGRESSLDRAHAGNRLRTFVGDGKHFRLAAAESRSAYAGAATEYSRTLALIGSDSADCYLVDVFNVSGGEQHDYLLHGSADEDSEAVLNGVSLAPFTGTLLNPGARFTPPAHQNAPIGNAESAYGFVKDLRRGESAGSTATLALASKATPRAGVLTHLLAPAGDGFFLGEAPSIRRASGGHLKEDESQLDRFQSPLFCWRRRGENLRSEFIAVHQPLSTKTPIAAVEKLPASGGALVVRIARGQAGTDYFLRAGNPDSAAQIQTPDGLLSFRGEYAWIRLTGARASEGCLVGRGELRLGGFARGKSRGIQRENSRRERCRRRRCRGILRRCGISAASRALFTAHPGLRRWDRAGLHDPLDPTASFICRLPNRGARASGIRAGRRRAAASLLPSAHDCRP